MLKVALPSTMRALVCPTKGSPLTLQHIETPQPKSGSVIVKVLAASIDANLPRILSGKGFFTFPEPFVPGARSIGRIAAVGPDTTSLAQDQMVLVDPFLRARDNPDLQALFGIFDGGSPASKSWIADNWRNAAYAEFVSVPLENVHAINEEVLCNKLKYSIPDLTYLTTQVVAYGGLRGINLQPGETVLVAPATGGYSGAAIGVAIAMGATVIAASRNLSLLQQIQSYFPEGRVQIVQLKNDVETDTASLKALGPVDAYIDISPPAAEQSTHVRSCFNALRQYGRASLMGVLHQDVAVPYATAVFKNLTIRGQYMYERHDVRGLIRLAESGVLKLGNEIGCGVVGNFGLDHVEEAIKCAEKNDNYGQITVLTPQTSA